MDSNSVSFGLKLEDYNASANLRKFGGTAHDVFGATDKEIGDTQQSFNELGRPVEMRVNSDALRRAQGDIESINEGMKRLGEMRLIGGMAAGELLARGVERGADFLREQAKDVLGGGMEEALTKMQMNVLMGDEVGKKIFEGTKDYIKGSMFGDSLFEDEATLKAMGEHAGNLVQDMKMFGDISMGNAEKVNSLSLAFGEVLARGSMSGMERRMFIRSGHFDPITTLAEHMPGNVAANAKKLLDMQGDGKFTAEMVRKSFEEATSSGGRFFGMMNREMDTAGGQWKMMLTNIDFAKKELGEAMQPTLLVAMKDLEPIIAALPGELERMRPAFENIIKGAGESIKWISNNTDTIGRFASGIKLVAEAWVAWKVGSAAAAAANWAWTASVGAQATASEGAGAAIAEETVAIEAQTGALMENTFAWINMGKANLAALDAVAAKSFNLPALGAAGLAGSGASELGLGELIGIGATSVIGTIGGITTLVGLAGATAYSLWKNDDRGELMSASMADHLFGDKNVVHEGEYYDMLTRMKFTPGQLPTYYVNGNQDDPGVVGGLDFSKDFQNRKNLPATHKSNDANAADISDESASLISGGRKVVNINFRNFVEHMTNQYGGVQEGVHETEYALKEMFVRVLESADKAVQ